MTIGDIAILERGLEEQAAEIARAEREGSTANAAPTPVVPGVPMSAAEERQLAIQQYEQQHPSQPQGNNSAQRLSSMGITVTRAEDEL